MSYADYCSHRNECDYCHEPKGNCLCYERLPIWECPSCGKQVRCDPVASDDWGGEEVAVGPECLECEEEMEAVL